MGLGASITEFAEKPQFYSTECYFLVVLPNRSVAEPAQTAMDLPEMQSTFRKTQLSDDKTHFTYEKTQLAGEDRDWELIYFRDVFLKERGEGMRKKPLSAW